MSYLAAQVVDPFVSTAQTILHFGVLLQEELSSNSLSIKIITTLLGPRASLLNVPIYILYDFLLF